MTDPDDREACDVLAEIAERERVAPAEEQEMPQPSAPKVDVQATAAKIANAAFPSEKHGDLASHVMAEAYPILLTFRDALVAQVEGEGTQGVVDRVNAANAAESARLRERIAALEQEKVEERAVWDRIFRGSFTVQQQTEGRALAAEAALAEAKGLLEIYVSEDAAGRAPSSLMHSAATVLTSEGGGPLADSLRDLAYRYDEAHVQAVAFLAKPQPDAKPSAPEGDERHGGYGHECSERCPVGASAIGTPHAYEPPGGGFKTCSHVCELTREHPIHALPEKAETPDQPWCKARSQGTPNGQDPADCDWPDCGCEPPTDRTAWLPPTYAEALMRARVAAKPYGWAIALHGSGVRDLDLVAVPWTAEACAPEYLMLAVKSAVKGYVAENKDGKSEPVIKPHGRLCWSIHLGGGPFIDLSVMPTITPPAPAPRAETETRNIIGRPLTNPAPAPRASEPPPKPCACCGLTEFDRHAPNEKGVCRNCGAHPSHCYWVDEATPPAPASEQTGPKAHAYVLPEGLGDTCGFWIDNGVLNRGYCGKPASDPIHEPPSAEQCKATNGVWRCIGVEGHGTKHANGLVQWESAPPSEPKAEPGEGPR